MNDILKQFLGAVGVEPNCNDTRFDSSGRMTTARMVFLPRHGGPNKLGCVVTLRDIGFHEIDQKDGLCGVYQLNEIDRMAKRVRALIGLPTTGFSTLGDLEKRG